MNKSDMLELVIHNLRTKSFIKFDVSLDFKLIIQYEGQEMSFKLKMSKNTISIINVLILGNRK